MQKAKADREIGAAALDLYFQQMEDMQDRSGPYVMVYQNYIMKAIRGNLTINTIPIHFQSLISVEGARQVGGYMGCWVLKKGKNKKCIINKAVIFVFLMHQ